MKRGKLISLEGIDGVGKTTCATKLCESLCINDRKFVYVNRKEVSTENDYLKLHMEYLYSILWSKGKVFSKAPCAEYNGLNRQHWLHLMISWYCAFEQIQLLPILEQGISVITDGYIYKEIVKAIYSSENFETEHDFDFLYKPDIVIYLTASPSECLREDSDTNRVESGKFVDNKNDFVKHQDKMNSIYNELARNKNWIKITRDKNVDITCKNILNELCSILKNEEELQIS